MPSAVSGQRCRLRCIIRILAPHSLPFLNWGNRRSAPDLTWSCFYLTVVEDLLETRLAMAGYVMTLTDTI